MVCLHQIGDSHQLDRNLVRFYRTTMQYQVTGILMNLVDLVDLILSGKDW